MTSILRKYIISYCLIGDVFNITFRHVIIYLFFCNVPLTEIKFPDDITQEVTSCLLGKHFINFNAVLSTSLDLLNIQLVNSRRVKQL